MMTHNQHLWSFKHKSLVSKGQVCSNFHVNVSQIYFKFLLKVQMFGETDGCITMRQLLHDAILGENSLNSVNTFMWFTPIIAKFSID